VDADKVKVRAVADRLRVHADAEKVAIATSGIGSGRKKG